MHDLSILITLTGALAVALVFGWITQRIGLSTLVGYMLAGLVVGPYTPGFVADTQLASQMAEIGVILLMFGVGMHFHPQELLRVWRIAVPGAIAQSGLAAIAGWASARAFGWSHGAGIVFGMALAVASTVVLMRMLVEQERLSSRDGHVAVGWLIVEDLFTVVALVVLPALAAGPGDAGAMGKGLAIALGKAGAFAVLIWLLGNRLVSPVMELIVRTRATELFTLAVFVLALGVAIIAAEVFHVSVALGAFFAGLVVGQSRFGAQATADMAPFRDVFSALFFVSIGMLFNPSFVVTQPWIVLVSLAIVLVAKPLIALGIVLIMRDTWRTALTVAVGLGQIGEFSFILAALGQSLDILPREGMDALVVAAIVSIAINPLLFRLATRIGERTETRQESVTAGVERGGAHAAPAVLIAGSSDMARRLAQRCADAGMEMCLVDADLDAVEALRREGLNSLFGDPGRAEVLKAAGIDGARIVVVATDTLNLKMRVCMAARETNPRASILTIADNHAERAWLEEFRADTVLDVTDEMTAEAFRLIRVEI